MKRLPEDKLRGWELAELESLDEQDSRCTLEV